MLTTRSAVLQALRRRPGYGLELVRRLAQNGLAVAEARVYPVLKELESAGLVESVQLAPKGRRGARTRTYYHLTPTGAAAAEAERTTLLALLVPTAVQPTPRERARMAAHLMEAEELSESSVELQLTER
jgi:DNA-binding PadR family transcriptional regulator